MPLIGIDLGTTFSAVAFVDPNGTPTTIPNAEGELTTPSVILFEKDGSAIVGREARRASLVEHGRTADYIKRYIGESLYPRLVNGKQISPVLLSSLILKKLKQDAEKKIGNVDGAVITVPAYFDEARRQATAAAGKLAGLKVVDIINEPTSAALAYAYRSMMVGAGQPPTIVRKELAAAPLQTLLVYDLGGGTFDVTIVSIDAGELRVVATTGDVKLGGRDWDERLFTFAADAFVRAHGDDPRDDPSSYQNLMLASEEGKRVLSQRKQTSIVVNHAGNRLAVEVTREQFEHLTADILYRTESRLGRVLKQAKLSWEKIDQVLVVGGSTRMPQVLEMLKRVTGKDPNCSLSPDEAVAHGAAIHAAVCGLDAPTKASPDYGFGIATDGSSEPTEASVPGLLSYFKNKVVSLLLSIRTSNVNAHSLGVVVNLADRSERVSVLIPHDTQLPVSVTKRFGTNSDNQKSVTVRIIEGESSKPAECLLVGTCQIQQLPPGLPKGSPIDITFTYDNSCRLHVKARDAASGCWAAAIIQRTSGLPVGGSALARLEEATQTPVS